MTGDASFRHLLRWYPRRWRRENGAVMLGTMLDSADHEGRAKPTLAERRSAALHGSAAHLTARLALVAAVIATVVGALGGAAMVWGPATLLPTIHHVLNAAVIPLLLTVALASIVRVRGWASDGSAFAFLAIGGASIVLGALAHVGWSQAFDAADMGRDASGLGAAFVALALAGIATGTIAIALISGSALRRTLPSRIPRTLVTAALGLIGAVSIAWILFVPLTAGVLSVGVVWLASRLPSSSARTRTQPADATHQAARTSTRHAWGPLALAALSIVGIVLAYRFSPEWSAMMPWLQASAVVGAFAIAWWLIPRHGAALGIAAGLVWAAPLGVFLAPALAFATPVWAVIAFVRQSRVRRAKAPQLLA